MKVQAIWEDGAVRLGLIAECRQERRLLDSLPCESHPIKAWKDQKSDCPSFEYRHDERVTALWVEIGRAPMPEELPPGCAQMMESE
jgi:hypothetical protein